MTNEIEKDKKSCPLAGRFCNVSKSRWIRFAVVTLLYLVFTVWVGNYWLCLGIFLIIDIYLTRFIPWGGWKKSKNPTIRKRWNG